LCILNINLNNFFKDLRAYLDGDDRSAYQSKKHVSLDVKSSKELGTLLKGSGAQSSEDEFESQRRSFQGRKHKSLDPRHISFKLDKEPTPETSSEEDDLECERTSLLMIDPDITKPVVIDLKVRKYYSSHQKSYLTIEHCHNFRILTRLVTKKRIFKIIVNYFKITVRSARCRKSPLAFLIWI
jgi:hypothetical protein